MDVVDGSSGAREREFLITHTKQPRGPLAVQLGAEGDDQEERIIIINRRGSKRGTGQRTGQCCCCGSEEEQEQEELK